MFVKNVTKVWRLSALKVKEENKNFDEEEKKKVIISEQKNCLFFKRRFCTSDLSKDVVVKRDIFSVINQERKKKPLYFFSIES